MPLQENEFFYELAAALFEAEHSVPREFDTACPHVAKRLRDAVKVAADKVRQGYCPIKADRELKEELSDFVLANVGACNKQNATMQL